MRFLLSYRQIGLSGVRQETIDAPEGFGAWDVRARYAMDYPSRRVESCILLPSFERPAEPPAAKEDEHVFEEDSEEPESEETASEEAAEAEPPKVRRRPKA